jgi:hypothetical protein
MAVKDDDMNAWSTQDAATAKRILDKLEKEQKLKDEAAVEERIKVLVDLNKKKIGSSSSSSSKTGDDKTADTLLNIISAVALSVVTLMFLHYYGTNPVFVLVACCSYIVVYGAFITFVINRVETCFEDNTLAIVARWSTILALVLSTLLAISTVKAALFSRGGKPGPDQRQANAPGQGFVPGQANAPGQPSAPGQGRRGPRVRNGQPFAGQPYVQPYVQPPPINAPPPQQFVPAA